MDDSTLEGNWALMCRVPRSDRIVETIKKLVIQLWIDNTHPSPNRRDIMKQRNGPKEYLQHAKHWLDVTQNELYLSFCNLNLDTMIGQTMFERLKPYFVKINRSFETCCCRYHVEFDLYYEVF